MIITQTPRSKKLLPGDIVFCREYVANADSVEAYRKAYPGIADGLTDRRVRMRVTNLLKRDKIKKYLKQLHDSLAISLQVDTRWVVNRFIELYEQSTGQRVHSDGLLHTDVRAAAMILSKLSDYTGGFDKNDKTDAPLQVAPVVNVSVVDNNTSVELQNTINILSENKTPAKQAHPQGKPREIEYTEITEPEPDTE